MAKQTSLNGNILVRSRVSFQAAGTAGSTASRLTVSCGLALLIRAIIPTHSTRVSVPTTLPLVIKTAGGTVGLGFAAS